MRGLRDDSSCKDILFFAKEETLFSRRKLLLNFYLSENLSCGLYAKLAELLVVYDSNFQLSQCVPYCFPFNIFIFRQIKTRQFQWFPIMLHLQNLLKFVVKLYISNIQTGKKLPTIKALVILLAMSYLSLLKVSSLMMLP
jgi:hypothetical protein